MTSSIDRASPRVPARRVLAALKRELDEAALARRIDQPIDAAMSAFRFEWRQPVRVRDLHQVVGDLISALNGAMGIDVEDLAGDRVRGLGLEILQMVPGQTYQDILVLIHDDPDGGIDRVLTSVGQTFKALQREQAIRWVFTRRVQPLPWPIQRELAHLVREQCANYLPDRLNRWPAGMLIRQIPVLMETWAQVDQQLQNILTDPVERLP